jgi:hypothetical protein
VRIQHQLLPLSHVTRRFRRPPLIVRLGSKLIGTSTSSTPAPEQVDTSLTPLQHRRWSRTTTSRPLPRVTSRDAFTGLSSRGTRKPLPRRARFLESRHETPSVASSHVGLGSRSKLQHARAPTAHAYLASSASRCSTDVIQVPSGSLHPNATNGKCKNEVSSTSRMLLPGQQQHQPGTRKPPRCDHITSPAATTWHLHRQESSTTTATKVYR